MCKSYNFRLKYSQLNFDVASVYQTLKLTDSPEDNLFTPQIEEIYSELENICEIKGHYTIYNQNQLLIGKESISLAGVNLETGKQIARYMQHAEQIAIFVCTAGEKFTRLKEEYDKEFDYLKGYIADTFGSLIVEYAMNYIQEKLEASLKQEGLAITNRYSPGYCNWPLNNQGKLFGLLNNNTSGIKLTPSSLMIPIKSVSGIIGIGKRVKKNRYGCKICNNQTCIYRNIINPNKNT